MNLKKIIIASALAFGLNAGALAAKEGVDYEVLPKTMSQTQQDKVEVLEFFGYFCIHCKNLDPTLLKHAKSFPSDTYLRTEHVVWDEGRDMNLARIAAAVNQSGEKYAANPAIFKAIFDEKVNLSDAGITAQWLSSQTTFNGKKVLEAYNSFSNQAQAKQMADYTAEYQVQSTPTIIVGGKYKVIFTGDYASGMKTIDELVQKVREEKGMKAPKPKAAAPKSKGASFAKAALN